MLWELASLSMGRSMLCEDHGVVTDAAHADSISWAIVSPALAADKTVPKPDKWGKVRFVHIVLSGIGALLNPYNTRLSLISFASRATTS